MGRTEERRIAAGRWGGWAREAVLLVLLAWTVHGSVTTTGPIGPISVFLPLLAGAAFAAGRLSAHRYPAPAVLAVAVGESLLRVVVPLAIGAEPWSGMADAIVTLLFGVFPWFTGRYMRQRSELLDSGWERVAALERERDAVAEQERLRERARIAEEMHDSLGHDLSLIAVRAGGLEVAPGLSEEDYREGVGELRARASEAIGRLHEVIGLLERSRGQDGAGAPLGRLIGRARSSGMEIAWDGTEPPGDHAARTLLFAVVREALTNAAKHAPGAAVTVEVGARRRGRTAFVRVANGPADAGLPVSAGGGRGLSSLRDRVERAGGALESGPTGGGGFAVAAHLSATAAAAARERPVRARRELAVAVATATAVLLPLVVGWYAYGAYLTENAVLTREEFSRLAIGQDRAAVEERLPAARLPTAVVDPGLELLMPEDADECRYYRSPRGPEWSPDQAFQVCFSGGELVSACVYDRRPTPDLHCKEDGDA
ncbi:sensor histidine kinase [Nocardiopsis suaedae]|uniref:histidine kinase n=1 Tax=Nocardiopsis suaedae TaxID=3018444 RepID=A0ABT4TM88_9ACTN|nr:histidine kinase [Nocardiopsis suaedae]MDA2805785.1 histidine kinase [Nocardiopsis suaedae]